MPGLTSPSWPLLLWCGLAAAIASEWIAGLFASPFRRSEKPRPAAPRLMSRPRGSTLVSLLTGTLLFAPIYGTVFEFIGHADLATGALFGAIHGILATGLSVWASRRSDGRIRPPVRFVLFHRAARTAVRVIYGATLGFLYVVPMR